VSARAYNSREYKRKLKIFTNTSPYKYINEHKIEQIKILASTRTNKDIHEYKSK